jgi:hypothetical protein
MSDKAKEAKYIRAQVPGEERCVFTTIRGNRCTNSHLGNATGLCILHEGRTQKADDNEARAVAKQLLAKNVELATRDDVNRLTSQLFTMVAEKRISRQDGSLLAYIASVLLQTITLVRRKADVPERVEFPESVAAPIPRDREELNRRIAQRFAQEQQMPGRNYNPYLYPSITRKR